MPVPKKKTSKARTRSRRSASWYIKQSGRSICSQCGVVKRPHHACKECGWYHSRQAIEVAE
ncbi:MAG: 50S ribosomal protein L32 [Acidimicrobiaceae bacterium]|nr:50S ribosomal protein L32 [Acidimicrobiaceae bacterium]